MVSLRSVRLFAIFAHAAGSQVKVATWNVAGMERASSEELSQNILNLNADIVLTQEDVEFEPPGSNNGIGMMGYKRACACREDALRDASPAYALGGRYLQNAVYVRQSTIRVVRSFSQNLSDTSPITRCAAFVDFVPISEPFGQPFRVASLHLTSGSFVVSNWRNFATEKLKQARQVLNWQPDIAAGDLNSYLDAWQVEQAQRSFEPYLQAQNAGDVYEYFGFATGGLDELLRGGMSRVPADRPTSIHGGTTDHMLWRSSARVSWVAGQGSITADFNGSDHAAVLATFDLVVLPYHTVAADRPDSRRRLQEEATGRALAEIEAAHFLEHESCKTFTSLTSKVICNTEVHVDHSIRAVVMSQTALYVCLFALLVIVPLCPFSTWLTQYAMPWRTFLTSVVVLHIFFDPDFLGHYEFGWDLSAHPVWTSMLFVAIESCFLIAASALHGLIKYLRPGLRLGAFNEMLSSDDDLVAHNKYRDLSLPFRKCAIVFLLQCGMLVFFFEELNESDLVHEGDVSLVRWVLAVAVVYYAKDDELGGAFHLRYWSDVVNAIMAKWKAEKLGKPYRQCLEVCVRGFMSYIINGLGLHFMRRTVPIFLCVQSHFDFTTNALGVFFIVALDSLGNQSATVVDNAKDMTPIGIIPGFKSVGDVVNSLFNEATADKRRPKTGDGGKDTETDQDHGDGDGPVSKAPLLDQAQGDGERPARAVQLNVE